MCRNSGPIRREYNERPIAWHHQQTKLDDELLKTSVIQLIDISTIKQLHVDISDKTTKLRLRRQKG